MDAVELNYPVDVVAAPKLLGSDGGGCGRDRVTVMEVEAADCGSRREVCKSLLSEKGATSTANFLESTSSHKVPDPELFWHTINLSNLRSEAVTNKQDKGDGGNGPSSIPRSEEVRLQRKAGQVSRSASACQKRARTILLEGVACPPRFDETKNVSNKLGSHPPKSECNEKTQLTKQKNHLSTKRGDRRNCKASTKGKNDSFSLKASLASLSSAASGNNFFGLYGLKTDTHDITKLVDDLSLNELLQGTCECPSLGKDKEKKATSTGEDILHSIRKACSILQLPRSTQIQNLAETDGGSNEKIPANQVASVSIVGNADNGNLSITDPSSSKKDCHGKFETPANLLNFSFNQPKDTLEHLALPPPKDLESLLLDATKPIVSSRNVPDPRPGKQVARRPSLPPFQWSHNFNGHCRNNSDAVKILTSRSTCQGRWMKVGNSFSSVGTSSNCFTNLESLVYDGTLVPICGPKLDILETGNIASSSSATLYASVAVASSTSRAHQGNNSIKESAEDLRNQEKAAQTLCDIATYASRLNQDEMMKWPKRPSQKAMKARKLKSSEKPEDIFEPSTSTMGSDHTSRSGADQILTSKRPRLSTFENKKDHVHINGVRKGSINWSTPKSSRSSPNKSGKDPIAYVVKQSSSSCMMPPPSKVLNRNCNGQQKVRKLMRMDWNRESDRQN